MVDVTSDTGEKPSDDYGRALAAGFSKSELGDWAAKQGGFSEADLPNELAKINAATPTRATAPQPTPTAAPPPPIVPEPLPEPPGAFSPAAEQQALRAADSIENPHERIHVQALLKQKYANDRMMDGVTAAARAEGRNTASASYINAADKLMAKVNEIGWSKTQLYIQQLVKTARDDPRLQWGDTADLVAKHIYETVGMPNPTELGRNFGDLRDALLRGEIRTNDQILRAEAPGPNGEPPGVTIHGGNTLMQMRANMSKPEERILVEKQGVAENQAKILMFKDPQSMDTQGNVRPSEKQEEMLNKFRYTLLNELQAAGDDPKEKAKILTSEHVAELVEGIYPLSERLADRMSHGAPVNYRGVVVPEFIEHGTKSEKAYRQIVMGPPFAMNPDTKHMEPIGPKGWQMTVDALLSNPTQKNIDAFNEKFASGNETAEYILKSVRTITPPPNKAPVPVVPAAREAIDLTPMSPSTALNKAIDASISGVGMASGVAADQLIAALRASLSTFPGIPAAALNKTIDTVIGTLASVATSEAKKHQAIQPAQEAKK